MNFMVEVSARHVHLCQEDIEALFGKGYSLTFDRALSQPEQFLCKEKVTVQKGDKAIERVAILGPARPKSQVELSRTDCFALKAQSYLRESGDISGSESITLIGTNGSIDLSEGLIIAKRHIHMSPEDAKVLGVIDKQIVHVAIETNERKLIFGDVVVRISTSFTLSMHVDTDEGNAGLIPREGCKGHLITVY